MRLKPIFYGKIENRKLTFDNTEQLKNYIANLKGDIQLTIEPRKKNRSLKQNSYYWGVVIPMLCEYCGYTPEEMHEALKIKFLTVYSDVKNIPPTIRSTTSLSTVEFEELVSRVRMWASIELGVYVPNPNECEPSRHLEEIKG